LINNEVSGIREVPLIYKGEIFADFLKQINNQGKCLVSADDSFYITEASLKARESADKEKVVYF
jgi:hypothetical protein